MVFPLPLETMAVLSKTKGSGNLACVIREQGIPKGQSEERRWRSTFTPPYPNSPSPNGTTPTLQALAISSQRPRPTPNR